MTKLQFQEILLLIFVISTFLFCTILALFLGYLKMLRDTAETDTEHIKEKDVSFKEIIIPVHFQTEMVNKDVTEVTESSPKPTGITTQPTTASTTKTPKPPSDEEFYPYPSSDNPGGIFPSTTKPPKPAGDDDMYLYTTGIIKPPGGEEFYPYTSINDPHGMYPYFTEKEYKHPETMYPNENSDDALVESHHINIVQHPEDEEELNKLEEFGPYTSLNKVTHTRRLKTTSLPNHFLDDSFALSSGRKSGKIIPESVEEFPEYVDNSNPVKNSNENDLLVLEDDTQNSDSDDLIVVEESSSDSSKNDPIILMEVQTKFDSGIESETDSPVTRIKLSGNKTNLSFQDIKIVENNSKSKSHKSRKKSGNKKPLKKVKQGGATVV